MEKRKGINEDTAKEVLFIKKLEELKETAKLQDHRITEEQAQEFIKEQGLDEAQTVLFYEYAKQNGIGIGDKEPEIKLDAEDKSYLDLYLKELKELPEISESQKRAITMAAMAGDGDAKRQLTEAYLSYVVEIAKLYAGQGVCLEDLIGEGNVALSMGADMAGALDDPDDIPGMLGRMIMDAMEEYITVTVYDKKIDQKAKKRVQEVANKAKELAEDLRRKVTIEELMQETGMSEKGIRDALRISANQIEDIDAGE